MATNKMRNYITYALTLLQEKGHTSVILKAMGRAINKTITIGESWGIPKPIYVNLTQLDSSACILQECKVSVCQELFKMHQTAMVRMIAVWS